MIDCDLFFKWKDMESREYNIIVTALNPIGSFERQIDKKQILGRDGFVTVDYGAAYGDVYSIECYLGDNDHDLDDIKSWLHGTDRLSLSIQPDRYYKASIISKFDISSIIRPALSLLIQFDLQPYGYLFTGEDKIEITKNSTTIYNPGNYKSEPYVKITGSGAINFYINDKVIKFSNIDGYVEFDRELDEVHKGTTPKEDTASGETLYIQPGNNNISWAGTGTVEKVEIIPRWRCR